ncbi:hypothetical protein MHAEM_21536 [Mycolicibacterium phlei]|nr:hypothetical protein [Mycolicibacterium phlei]
MCYAGRTEKVRKSVLALLEHNYALLKDADRETMVALLSDMIADFVAECEKRGAPKYFRIHWDGDFFSPVYVAAWGEVVRRFADVRFWVYTRVPTAALYLQAQKLPNLALYFSADPENVETGRYLSSRGINVAYVADTFAEGKAAFPRATRCPENNKALPLIAPEGSACARCGLCINGRKDVLFAVKKR